MRYLAIVLLFFGLASPLLAQQEEDDKSFLEGKLQELLSGAGREVSITGFEGALSSSASLERMTISDADGVWLTLRDAQLVWTRRALFAGRLEIEDLSAREIEITRLPKSEEPLSPSDAQATPFALPDLPVAVNIDQINVEQILLAPEVLGEAATLTVGGNVTLSDGEGAARLEIQRTDRNDSLLLDGAFSNTSRVLRLDVDFSEAQDGLVSTLLNIPGTPALGLQIKGEAPLSDYTAQIELSSDGQRRFGGQVTVRSGDETDAGYAIAARLDGDVRPLFASDLHPFFGARSSLVMDMMLPPDGRTVLDRLEITSGALALSGTLALAADGWPERFDLEGRIGDGTPVILPSAGAETTVERLTIDASYNAAQGDTWTADIALDALRREGLSLGQARLTGQGQIGRAPAEAVSGAFDFNISALDPGNPDLARAIGPNPSGKTSFEWRPDAPLSITSLVVQSEDMSLNASATLDQLADGLPIRGQVRLLANDISRFSGLAGRDLAGVAIVELSGEFNALSGAFDLELEAQTAGLRLSQPRLDPLLSSDTTLSLSALRDTTGTRLRSLTLSNADAQITASGDLNADAGQLDVSSRLNDLSLVEPKLSGDGEVQARVAWQAGAPIRLEALDARLNDTTLEANGQLDPENPLLPAEGELSLVSGDLSRFATLLGKPLAGRLMLNMQGSAELQGENFDLGFELEGTSVRSGVAQLDRLIAGDISATGSAALDAEALDLRYFKLVSPQLRANATGSGPGAPIALSARISDLGLLGTGISGPAAVRGTVTLQERLAQRMSLDLDATGPGGIAARITGTINELGQALSLSAVGTGPLQLANPFISPRSIEGDARFDLSLQGPPSLSSLSGDLSFAQARVALPRQNFGIGDLSGNLTLGNGSVAVDVAGNTGQGGQFQVSGPISLNPPFSADLAVQLLGLVMTDAQLYDTSLNGALAITGPLRGGALIGGFIELGRTELRVPSGSGVIIGTLPDLRHVNEPSAVRQTRARAGLTDAGNGGGASFPIDLMIRASNQIFVRGRGLDAELGGQIRLGGSTSNVVASGVFELIRGRLDILGKRLEMTEGLIDLRGSLDPYLRFVAETEAEDVLIRIVLEGLLSEPVVTFSSEPELPQDEVVARLIFGRGLDTISPFQAAQLVSAVAQLTGRYDGGLVGNLRQSLGLSDLDISTTDEGATQLRAGAYISDNIYSEVTADSDGKQQINLNLDVSKNVTVRGRADTDGDTGLGIFFEKDY